MGYRCGAGNESNGLWRGIERLGRIVEAAVDQAALAVVADAAPARPPHGYRACLGKLQERVKPGVPAKRNAAPQKCNVGPSALRARWQVRRLARAANDSRSKRTGSAKDLSVDS